MADPRRPQRVERTTRLPEHPRSRTHRGFLLRDPAADQQSVRARRTVVANASPGAARSRMTLVQPGLGRQATVTAKMMNLLHRANGPSATTASGRTCQHDRSHSLGENVASPTTKSAERLARRVRPVPGCLCGEGTRHRSPSSQWSVPPAVARAGHRRIADASAHLGGAV